MRRLHFVLAWSECIRAAWACGAGRPEAAALAVAAAARFLERGARSVDSGFRWRAILAPHHGLTVSGPEDEP